MEEESEEAGKEEDMVYVEEREEAGSGGDVREYDTS